MIVEKLLACQCLHSPGLQQRYLILHVHHLASSSNLIAGRAAFMQVADEVDEDFIILPNGQVAAQQRSRTQVRRNSPAPLRRSRSLSPKKPSGLLGKLCSRFKSPSNRSRRDNSNMTQAAAVAAYRDAYGGIPPLHFAASFGSTGFSFKAFRVTTFILFNVCCVRHLRTLNITLAIRFCRSCVVLPGL